MGKLPKCDENSIKKGAWTPEEDHKLADYINKHGHGSWRALPKLAGLNRCGKSCRLRWTNYLRPGIKRGKFSNEEEQTIMHMHSLLGNNLLLYFFVKGDSKPFEDNHGAFASYVRTLVSIKEVVPYDLWNINWLTIWSTIASHLPGRTDNEIKNFWNTRLEKKLIQMDLDPMTHKPRTDIFASLNHLLSLANLEYLVGQLPIQQEAMMLQKVLQMANLQQLHEYHLESNITDVDAPSLLNSYPENVSAQGFKNEVSINTMENANELLPNNHIALAPESPFSFQTHTSNNSQTNTSSFPSSYFPLPISQSNTTSLNNVGDAETTCASSHDAGELWPMNWSDLYFEEPFLHDIV